MTLISEGKGEIVGWHDPDESFTSLGEVDGVQQPFFNPHILSFQWLSKIKIPGRDLPENVSWQVDEMELMTVEDYDAVINKGYNQFFGDFIQNRLDNLGARMEPIFAFTPKALQNFQEAGVVTLSPIEG